jgi:hypothetical protein
MYLCIAKRNGQNFLENFETGHKMRKLQYCCNIWVHCHSILNRKEHIIITMRSIRGCTVLIGLVLTCATCLETSSSEDDLISSGAGIDHDAHRPIYPVISRTLKGKKRKKEEKTATPTSSPTATAYPTTSLYPTTVPTTSLYPTIASSSKSGKGKEKSSTKSGKGKKESMSSKGKGKGKGKGKRKGKGKGSNKSSKSNDEPSLSPTSSGGGLLTPAPTPATTLAPTLAPVPVTTLAPATTPAPTPDLFLTVLDLDSVAVQYRPAFVKAAARWSSVIIGNLEDVTITEDVRDDTACLNLPDVVNDVFICATIEEVDGPGGVLGFAGPEWLRDTGTELPFIGSMTFDSEDVDDLILEGSFEGVVVSLAFLNRCVSLKTVFEYII